MTNPIARRHDVTLSKTTPLQHFSKIMFLNIEFLSERWSDTMALLGVVYLLE